MTVSGKYFGTNGIGPIMRGLAASSERSRRAASVLRRMMLIAIPKEIKLSTPTLPPTAPAKVAIFFSLVILWRR